MTQFYYTKEFYYAVAFATLAIIVILFSIRKRIFPENKPLFENWQLSADFIELKTLIQCAQDEKELQRYAERVEKFYDLHFNIDQDNKDLINRYGRLLEAIEIRRHNIKIPA